MTAGAAKRTGTAEDTGTVKKTGAGKGAGTGTEKTGGKKAGTAKGTGAAKNRQFDRLTATEKNAVTEYWMAIRRKEVIVGKWIRLLYEVILQGIIDKRWFFDARRGNNAIDFLERYCHHFKGKMAPGRIRLELWERASIFLIFGVVDGQGRRQFREVAWFVGRKMGKSLIGGGTGTYLSYTGEFGSEIYFLATKIDQADLSYSSLEFNINHEQELAKRTRSTKRGLVIDETNTIIRRLPFTDKSLDGLNPMFALGDELSSWPAAKGLRVWEVIMSGIGAREEPLIMGISSGGYVNGGIYDELFARGTAFLNGSSREEHLLPIFYKIDDESKWKDLKELRKALPGLGVSVNEQFIRDEIATAEQSASKKTEFLTKYCNLKQNPTVSWFTADEINRCFGYGKNNLTPEDFRQSYALGGIDLSLSIDLSCSLMLCMKDGITYFLPIFFMPRETMEKAEARDGIPYRQYAEQGWLIPSGEHQISNADCENWFYRLENEYEILFPKTGYDRYTAGYLVESMKTNGFDMESVSQGPNLTGVIIDTEGMIRDGTLQSANQNPLMKIHMIDSALQMDTLEKKRQLVKIQRGPHIHIDGMAALLCAMCMRRNYFQELENMLRNDRSE